MIARGSLVIAVLSGDYGKARPALVVQSDDYGDLPSIVILPVASMLVVAPSLRIDLPADPSTGLAVPSQVMVDKIIAVPATRLKSEIGVAPMEVLRAIDLALLRLFRTARNQSGSRPGDEDVGRIGRHSDRPSGSDDTEGASVAAEDGVRGRGYALGVTSRAAVRTTSRKISNGVMP